MERSQYYPSPSNEAIRWGLYVVTAGYVRTDPHQTYPLPDGHPTSHAFTWNTGRVLDGYHLVYVARGGGVFESARTPVERVEAGTCFFLFPGIWHRYKPDDTSGWEEYWVGFRGIYAESLFENGFFDSARPFVRVGQAEELLAVFRALLDSLRLARPGYAQVVAGLTTHLLGRVYAASVPAPASPPSRLAEGIVKAQFLLQSQLEEPLDSPALARSLPMSYSVFRREFKRQTGTTPARYHLTLRLAKAEELLRLTALDVSEVAFHLGFESGSYFSKVFRKCYGLSPLAYRKALRPTPGGKR